MSLIVGRLKAEVEERSKVIRTDLLKRYDLGELREQLYMEQESICAVCNKPMQGSSSALCEVDHATSVYIYASWSGSIEEACEHANARKNLAAAHVPCNRTKRQQELEEFHEKVESGEIVLGEVPLLTEHRIRELRDQLSENGRKAGRIGGRKAVESGQLAHARSLPQSKEAQRIVGRKAVESGHMTRMSSLPQTKEARRQNGRKNVESGRIQGLKNVESGQIQALGHMYGRIQGLKSVESGLLTKGRHTRWHVNRGISKPECALCAAALKRCTKT